MPAVIPDSVTQLIEAFAQLPGIGPKTEQKLWRGETLSWQDALEKASLRKSERELRESLRRLKAGDADYFYATLPSAQQWRPSS